jgi:hypothetical protein
MGQLQHNDKLNLANEVTHTTDTKGYSHTRTKHEHIVSIHTYISYLLKHFVVYLIVAHRVLYDTREHIETNEE